MLNKSSQDLEKANSLLDNFKENFEEISYKVIKNTALDYYRYQSSKKISQKKKLSFDKWFDKYVINGNK